MDEQDEKFIENFNNNTYFLKDGNPFKLTCDMFEKIIDYFEKESFKQVSGSSLFVFVLYLIVQLEHEQVIIEREKPEIKEDVSLAGMHLIYLFFWLEVRISRNVVFRGLI